MGEIFGFLLEAAANGLTLLLDAIPDSRWQAVGSVWAWPMAICIAVGVSTLAAACYFGHSWLYQLALAICLLALGLACLAAFCSRE